MTKQHQRNQMARHLRELRYKSGLSQDKLALKLGITRSVYGAYEEGRAMPNFEVIKKLVAFYNLASTDVFFDNPLPQSVSKSKEQYIYDKYLMLTKRDQKIVDMLLGITH